MVKLKDIAEHLNVSVSTVSRVVNNKDRVDPKTREKILKALKEFNYKPNEVARNLKKKTSKTIGIIVPDISNFFFAMVIKGAEGVARQNGYSILLCNSDEDIITEEHYAQLLLQKQISGLIIGSVGGNIDIIFKQYIKSKIPVVFIDNLPKIKDNFDFVTIDNIKASYDLTNHLINLGHKNIAIITGRLDETTAYERLKGWEKSLKEHNIPVKKEWIGIGDFKQESGYKIMEGFLKMNEIPTAVFAANNHLAYGAMRAIIDAGLKVPDDIAMVCFDAIDPTGLIKPQITSIVQPAEEIGKIAAEIIMRKTHDSNLKIFEKVILEPQLIIKESSGAKDSVPSKLV
ncbi:LacI family transcriptional regulator [Thermoanaerobacteraceae bacterium SP2]|nr:LacI family transcriptional regulator [Thermoanaerobacteraceae bacterium SP2]